MNSINKDLRRKVAEYLPFMDFLTLRSVNKDFKLDVLWEFKKRMTRVIMRICDVSMEDACELQSRVIERGGVFSGSAVLQVLLDETWESDLDVYFHTGRDYERNDIYRNVLKISSDLLSDEELNVLKNQIGAYEEEEPSKKQEFVDVAELRKPTMSVKSSFSLSYDYRSKMVIGGHPHAKSPYDRIQIIECDTQRHVPVWRDFDMSQVMNGYGKDLEIYNVDMLRRREGTLFCRSTAREKKYMGRGFEIINAEPYSYMTRYAGKSRYFSSLSKTSLKMEVVRSVYTHARNHLIADLKKDRRGKLERHPAAAV